MSYGLFARVTIKIGVEKHKGPYRYSIESLCITIS
nr:MAG TPA: hypothetical protein [Caudoviricetes sp.]